MTDELNWEEFAEQIAQARFQGRKPCRICRGKGYLESVWPASEGQQPNPKCPECNGLGYDTGAHLVG